MKIEGVPTEAVHAYRDFRGIPTMVIDNVKSPLLAAAFEHDIQTASIVRTIYHRLTSVTAGYDSRRSYSGNSCTVTITLEGVTIQNDILQDEDVFEMSVQQYRTILDVWYAFLTS